MTKHKANIPRPKSPKPKDQNYFRSGHISVRCDDDEEPPPKIVDNIEEDKDGLRSQKCINNIYTFVDNARYKYIEQQEVFSEEDYETDELADEYSDVFDNEFIRHLSPITNNNRKRKMSTDNEDLLVEEPIRPRRDTRKLSSSPFSSQSTDFEQVPPPYLPIYHETGVHLGNLLEDVNIASLVLPPFSNHLRKAPFPRQKSMFLSCSDVKQLNFNEKDVITLAHVNQQLTDAARKLTKVLPVNPPFDLFS